MQLATLAASLQLLTLQPRPCPRLGDLARGYGRRLAGLLRVNQGGGAGVLGRGLARHRHRGHADRSYSLGRARCVGSAAPGACTRPPLPLAARRLTSPSPELRVRCHGFRRADRRGTSLTRNTCSPHSHPPPSDPRRVHPCCAARAGAWLRRRTFEAQSPSPQRTAFTSSPGRGAIPCSHGRGAGCTLTPAVTTRRTVRRTGRRARPPPPTPSAAAPRPPPTCLDSTPDRVRALAASTCGGLLWY